MVGGAIDRLLQIHQPSVVALIRRHDVLLRGGWRHHRLHGLELVGDAGHVNRGILRGPPQQREQRRAAPGQKCQLARGVLVAAVAVHVAAPQHGAPLFDVIFRVQIEDAFFHARAVHALRLVRAQHPLFAAEVLALDLVLHELPAVARERPVDFNGASDGVGRSREFLVEAAGRNLSRRFGEQELIHPLHAREFREVTARAVHGGAVGIGSVGIAVL